MSPTLISHESQQSTSGFSPEPDFINHDLSVSLDSTDAFEGPEKLLEIWFAPSSSVESVTSVFDETTNGLRKIPLSGLEEMLDLVSCKILSKISTREMDAYLLSESSLFVYPHKMILKTCGTTTTLFCLGKLLELLKEFCGYKYENLTNIYRIFYSRRSYMFPDKQNEIHQHWDNELDWLNKYFHNETSKAYVVGDISRDHWYLYLNGSSVDSELDSSYLHGIPVTSTNGDMYPLSPVRSNSSQVPTPVASRSTTTPDGAINSRSDANSFDQTFELLMTELDPRTATNFQLSKHQNEFPNMNPTTEDYGHLLGHKMMESTGLDSVITSLDNKGIKAKHDAFAFTPCGFSSNSILNNEYYYTLHITPEVGWSYASFESNYPGVSKVGLLRNVINVMKPGKFSLVLVEEGCLDGNGTCFEELKSYDVDGYQRIDKIVYDLQFNYRLLYSFFEKARA